MLCSTCMLVLGLAAAAFAQESSYTGPAFNPSEAPYFDYNSLVIPTQTTLPAIQPTDAFSMATTISGILLPTTPLSRSSAATSRSSSHSSSHSASSSASSSASRLASSTVSSAPTSASTSAAAQQSTAAAVANRAGVVGAVAGGLLAGLALA
ncbi:hypothetical protein BU25DRAFT_421783 [Macroventuria anomochaeta]|uniref:Uncharacterized protein n=1 Tax=Macroventuria anomochaeta TaxID=301207 RepID=A0ACB6RZB1_9PLEO|nr:uncharacterized protein BU25DRAFT_421783 [Macroventuria anomochaeta]KAF2627351.1 hypothetical protein BU25DRAFT_421783 [Macroventuria anomochaeta]